MENKHLSFVGISIYKTLTQKTNSGCSEYGNVLSSGLSFKLFDIL